ncbi:hypothetical protein SPB21_23165 [Leptothoe sp. ISB3NOV94-8A]|uniref:hypothetical protein n=1 Tax=Adonisia turfae TaxID=2950184 RepID=UPI0013D1EDE6|nr:hypothetical protein [Adonisia turfae]MDV3352356.1 hypothetical protein [Leptothoe sp. LEGE 181152]
MFKPRSTLTLAATVALLAVIAPGHLASRANVLAAPIELFVIYNSPLTCHALDCHSRQDSYFT